MAEVKIKDQDTGQEAEEKESQAETIEETEPEEEAPKTDSKEDEVKGESDSKEEEKAEEVSEDPENQDETEKEEAEKEETKKSGFFGKKKDKALEELKEKNAALADQAKRQMAEFDNFRKRTEKEKEQMFSMGEKSVAEKMLPIVDNFERGFTTVEEEDKDDAFVKGMEKVYQQMIKQLADIGVTPIEAVGKEFDPEFHNAVMQVESDEVESGYVAAELQKGYMYHDQVLRHSMVSVAK